MVSFAVHGLPLLGTLLLWFVSTALIVWLDSRPRETFPISLTVGGMLALAGVAVIDSTGTDTSAGAAYWSAAAALAVWGWHEMSFLMGVVTGPRRLPCPPEVSGWQRFRLATATVIHHEVALAATGVLLFALTWGEPNQAGAEVFAMLFVLRLSTKFNIFAGVPNFSPELLPAHLSYLHGYFRRGPAGPLFAVTLALSAALAWWFGRAALADGSEGDVAAATLLGGLALLGVIEHLFLALPLRDAALWLWASKSRDANTSVAPATGIE